MGIIKGTRRYKLFLANRSKHLMLRQLSFKDKKRHKLTSRYMLDSQYDYSRNSSGFTKTITLDVPSQFEIWSNHAVIIDFISTLLNLKKKRDINVVNLNLTRISSIDSSAICLLLSAVKELGYANIKVTGNYPQNEDCARYFIESGFLAHMKDEAGKPFQINSSNLIAEAGTNRTRNKQIAQAVRMGIKFILGEETRYPPAYTVAMEICSNSVEHAYRQRPKHWRLAISKVDEKVAFTMVDTGSGILKTLHRKFSKEIRDIISLRNHTDVLYRAFQRKYGSSTQLINRNKGLPCILDKFNCGLIKSLKVITNDVYLDFNSINEQKSLNKPFNGVLFYWEVDKECIDKFVKNIKI